MKDYQRHSGFTLIEVIVSISIFSLIGLGCYQVISGLSAVQSVVSDHSDSLRTFTLSMRLIEKDFEQLVSRSILDEYEQETAAVYTGSDDFVIEFSRVGSRNPLLANRAELIRVAYRVAEELPIIEEDDAAEEDGPDPGQVIEGSMFDEEENFLLRYTWPVLDRGRDVNPGMQVLMTGVTDLTIEFLDQDEEWHYDWPPSSVKQGETLIPVAIKLVIETEQYGKLERFVQIRDLPAEEK